MHCQRLLVLGDAHLGRESPEAERALLRFLARAPDLGDGLLLTGDLFEFWFAWRRAIPRRGIQVVAALARVRDRMPIMILGGNHDRWAGSFWADDLGIEFSASDARLTVGGWMIRALHGDGVTESHWSAGLLHRITRNPVTIGTFRLLHPDLGCWLVDHLSGVLGNATRDPADIGRAADQQRAWAESELRAEPGLSAIVMGHTHVPVAQSVGERQWYLNPGAWCEGRCYATVEEGVVKLERFIPGE